MGQIEKLDKNEDWTKVKIGQNWELKKKKNEKLEIKDKIEKLKW